MTDLKSGANPLFLREEELRQGMELLFFAYRDFTAEPDQILARYDFGRAHHRVIYFVGRHPAMTVTELLNILGITKQSLSRVLRQLVKDIPAERLMLETDAPFLLPRSLAPRPKGGRNEPAFLPHILSEVATCLDQSMADVAAATTCTARTFFAIDPCPIRPSRVDH